MVIIIVSCWNLARGIACRVALIRARQHKSAHLWKCLATFSLISRRLLRTLLAVFRSFICLQSLLNTLSSYFDLMGLWFGTTYRIMIWLHFSRVHLFKQLPFVGTAAAHLIWVRLDYELQTFIPVVGSILSFNGNLALVRCDAAGGKVLEQLAILLETH